MIYFFSDSHLGSRAKGELSERLEQQQKVVNMLRMMAADATEIYILGDLFDFWYEYLWPDRSKREYEPVLTQLKQMTDSGIKIHFYIGNHDIWTFGWLRRKTGMIIHRPNHEAVTIAGRECIIGHGDGLVPSNYWETIPEDFRWKLRKFLWLRHFFHNPIPQFLFRLLPPALGNAYGYNWAKNSRLKEMRNPYPYKGENHEELVLWAKEQEKRKEGKEGMPTYYIFGHRHVELDLLLRTGAHIILLGDTFRQWTYATMDENTGEISLLNYE